MAKIISIINFKGGVGKTTTTLNIGAGLAKFHDKKVLLIDLDPQTNLTLSMMSFKLWKDRVDESGSIKDLFEAFMNRDVSYAVSNSIIKSPIRDDKNILIPKLDLVPSHLSMLLIDLQLAKSFVIMGEFESKWVEMWEHRSILKQGLLDIKDDYDLILIDCPPNFNVVTQNAIFSSDYYIIPSIPDYLSVIGMKVIGGLVEEIDSIGEKVSNILKRNYSRTELLGILFNRVKIGSTGPVHLHQSKMEQIDNMYPNKRFESYISDSIALPESNVKCIPVFEYKSSKAHNSQEQFKLLCDEIINRIDFSDD